MLERFIHAVSVTDPGLEEPAATRERLKDRFPRGATRRMTQLGLLMSVVLDEVRPQPDDPIVYASAFGEGRALEGYLESFPGASPTLFQTSIHPSGVQQVMIGRQQPVREFYPVTGRLHLPTHAFQTAMLCDAARAILCGGEERGTWLGQHACASDRSFAFALALSTSPAGAIGQVGFQPTDEPVSPFTLPEFFDALTARQDIACVSAAGRKFRLAWT